MSTPVQSVDDFLQVIRRSGLVEETRLMAVVEPWIGHAAAPPEPLLQALEDSGLLTRWQIDQLLKGRYKGFTLGKYRLLRLLGAGGMSSVYLGEHATLHSKAAVKVLPVKRVEQSSYLARFEREARQSARLNHPNIVRTFDLDTAGSIHFIAMEYVDGIDLHAKVKRDGPLPIREVAEYIRQAAIGLQHAHEEGLVHRDIKPANLILDTRGTVKILDLGLALAGGDEDGSLTREHDEKVLGTADYLAPEQATDSHKADRRSDVYSLGCTLYYLLVGKAPFASGKLAERLQSHLHKPPPNLLDQRPDVPIAIAELYFRMLQKHPDGRPQSAQDVADALGAWLASGGGQQAGPRGDGQRRSLPRRAVGGSDAARGVVVRSGPGSGSSGIFPALPVGSAGGSGSLPATPSPSSIARAQSKPPAAPPARAATGSEVPLIRIDTGPVAPRSGMAGSTSSGGAPASTPADRRSRDMLGLPPTMWIAVVIGVVLAITLAVMLWLKQR
ncbi:MAG: serine/threonine-protein kinase [Pirellulales bacterium]|jgi:serine/threonine-protein kinase